MLALVLAGAVVTAFGILFHMQGLKVVGPEQSFMYGSSDWLGYGLWIAAVGMAVVVCGWWIARIRRRAGRRA